MTLKEELIFLKYCFQRRKDYRFVKNVMDVSNDSTLLNMDDMGGDLKQGYIYYIKMEPSYSGFFADHNRLLSLLFFADHYGLRPVIEYGEQYSYREVNPVNGTTNPFEYYFKQPCEIGLEELKQYKGILRSRKENAALAGKLNYRPGSGGYGMSEDYIDALAKISKQYIKLNDIVGPDIDKDIKGIKQDKKTLGVHVRGTDFKHNYNGHPICITPQEYLDSAISLVTEKMYEKVFLATDDSSTIKLFRKEFGDQLVYYSDVVRSDGEETVMHSAISRKNHHYLLGLEVLRDMYTLASCEGLIAGLSQVSYSARIQKESSGVGYQDLKIIDKGINYHQKENCPIK